MGRLYEALSGGQFSSTNPEYALVGQSASNNSNCAEDADRGPATFWRRYRGFISLQVLLVSLYSITAYVVITEQHRQNPYRLPPGYSPASQAIEWEQRDFFDWDGKQEEGNTYFGEPRKELDDAWHDLLRHKNIRIEPEAMIDLGAGNNSVWVPGEDWGLGTLNVYHELHCIRFLHQHIAYPEKGKVAKRSAQAHNEHCLDFLRQSAMCRADVGLITYRWETTRRDPRFNYTTHQCVNWERLDSWAGQRAVDVYKPGWLVHPNLGPVYTESEGYHQ